MINETYLSIWKNFILHGIAIEKTIENDIGRKKRATQDPRGSPKAEVSGIYLTDATRALIDWY